MLTLITGLPGASKTLNAIRLVEAERRQPGPDGSPQVREVYYHNIPDLDPALGWHELPDGSAWVDIPTGAIFVLDECQRTFPPRKQGAAVPHHVSQLETHRHRGLDGYLITQHPQLCDIAVRKLVQRHYDIRRPFGLDYAKVRQWERCVTPEDRAVQREAVESKWPLPKQYFGRYKSAEVHTVKRRLPVKQLALLAGALCAVIGLGWFAFASLGDRAAAEPEADARPAADPTGAQHLVRANPWSPEVVTPRYEALPFTAPRFDAFADPEDVPRIVGCLAHTRSDGTIDCRCFTQQATRVRMTARQCLETMEYGVFDATRQVEDAKAQNVAYLNTRDSGNASTVTGETTASVTRPTSASSPVPN